MTHPFFLCEISIFLKLWGKSAVLIVESVKQKTRCGMVDVAFFQKRITFIFFLQMETSFEKF